MEITAELIQELFFEARRRKEKGVELLAFDALEQGVGSEAWGRCERIIVAERKPKPGTPEQRARKLARSLILEREVRALESRVDRRDYYKEYRRRKRSEQKAALTRGEVA